VRRVLIFAVDQCSPNVDAVTSPADEDLCRAKKSLFETCESTTDTTSTSDSKQEEVNTADDGAREDFGRFL